MTFYNKISKTEKKLSYELLHIGLSPKVQYKVDQITVDFAFVKEKIVVEIDGPHHLKPEHRKKDLNRDIFLQTKGWRVIRIPADDAYNDPSKVAYKIKKFIESVSKIKDTLNEKKDEQTKKKQTDSPKKMKPGTPMIIIGIILTIYPEIITSIVGIVLIIAGINKNKT